MAKADTHTSAQLAECKEEVAALKQDLAEFRDAAPFDDQLLNSGLRLAMENAALRDKIAELNEEKTITNADSVVEISPTTQGSPSTPE